MPPGDGCLAGAAGDGVRPMGSLPNPNSLEGEYHPWSQAPGSAHRVIVSAGQWALAGPVTVQLAAPVPGSTVYYTLDGADPTVAGQKYTAPVVFKGTTVLRAVALDEGVPVSMVTTATYLVEESTGLPVLSLVTDPAHLWDATTGIYVNAEGRGRSWERPVTVEWLSPEGKLGFSVGAGLRIHGNISRTTTKKVVPAVLPGGVWATRVSVSAVWSRAGADV